MEAVRVGESGLEASPIVIRRIREEILDELMKEPADRERAVIAAKAFGRMGSRFKGGDRSGAAITSQLDANRPSSQRQSTTLRRLIDVDLAAFTCRGPGRSRGWAP